MLFSMVKQNYACKWHSSQDPYYTSNTILLLVKFIPFGV